MRSVAQFTHLCDQRDAARIVKNGISIARTRWRALNGVFAMPVLDNYVVTNQWMRELRRRGIRSFVGIRFRVPDDQPVHIGRYNQAHLATTAADAVRIAREHVEPLGLEVIVARRIARDEIIGVYRPHRVVGWRYFPEAHGRRPCPCAYCQRGQYGARKLIESGPDARAGRRSSEVGDESDPQIETAQ